MKLSNIKIKMPKGERAVERAFQNCEKRERFVKDTAEHYKRRLKKAKHDLSRAVAEFDDECWDWTIIKSYYAIFHAANTLLSKKMGLFSKDHSCLIIALKKHGLISDRLFLKLRSIYENFSDTVSMDLTFQLRKISQYDVDLWEDITEENASVVLGIAKEFVSFVEGEIID